MNDTQFTQLIQLLDRIAGALETLAHSQQETAAGETSFYADELVPEMLDDKLYWKVRGGDFRKHGVRIWPEVLAEAGFDKLPARKITLPASTWLATYTVNENGGPTKVTKLERVLIARSKLGASSPNSPPSTLPDPPAGSPPPAAASRPGAAEPGSGEVAIRIDKVG